MNKIESEPLVSVIIPTYGQPTNLITSINSVLDQDYSAVEIILVDDNNPDTDARLKTEKLMFENFNEISNVKYLKHEVNKNGSAARNTGFKYSHGKYICF